MKVVWQVTAALGIAASSLLVACSDTQNPVQGTQQIDYSQGQTKATVVVRVVDARTRAPIDSAAVSIAGGDSVRTNASGLAQFKGVLPGSYIVFLRCSGYEPVTGGIDVTLDQNSNTVPVVQQAAQVLTMSRKGVALRGRVFIQDQDTKVPADSARVELLLTSTGTVFTSPYQSAVTRKGEYSFTDLPEYATYQVSVMPVQYHGVTYAKTSATPVSGKAQGETAIAQAIVMTRATDNNFYVLSHNLAELSTAGGIEISFSEPVDTSLVRMDSIVVQRSSSVVLITRQWSADLTKLTVKPFEGKWAPGASYQLTIRRLQSWNGATLLNTQFVSYPFSVTSTGALGAVQRFRYRVGSSDTTKADYSTSVVTLLWAPLSNATSYEVYSKSYTDSAWIKVATVADTFASVSTGSGLANGKEIRFRIIGRNSTSASDVATAPLVTVRDQKRPRVALTGSAGGFNNTMGLTADTVIISPSMYYFSLPEPFDTTKRPAFSVKEASYATEYMVYGDSTYQISAAGCSWKWLTQTAGQVSAVVDAGRNGAYDTLIVDFSKLTDLAGNAVDTAGGGAMKFQTRP